MNLSSYTLSTTQEKVLEKGLGFVPTQNLDSFKLHCEINEFFRKIRLRVFFRNREDDDRDLGDSGLYPKSSFTPPTSCMPVELLA